MPSRSLKLRLLACGTLFLLGGCAVPTTAAFDARMSGLIGHPEAEVVAALGVPVRTHEAGGQRFLQYESRRLVTCPGSYPFGPYRYGYYGGFGGFPPSVEALECDLTFVLRNGRVEGFTRCGNDCRSVPPSVG
jgi:hypothetical protein